MCVSKLRVVVRLLAASFYDHTLPKCNHWPLTNWAVFPSQVDHHVLVATKIGVTVNSLRPVGRLNFFWGRFPSLEPLKTLDVMVSVGLFFCKKFKKHHFWVDDFCFHLKHITTGSFLILSFSLMACRFLGEINAMWRSPCAGRLTQVIRTLPKPEHGASCRDVRPWMLMKCKPAMTPACTRICDGSPFVRCASYIFVFIPLHNCLHLYALIQKLWSFKSF